MTRRKTAHAASAEPVMNGGVQLDLFGKVAQRLDRDERFRRLACFYDDGTPVTWTVIHACQAGEPGDVLPGWRCWLCGNVEATEALLHISHGLASYWPDSFTRTTCTRQELLASQARAERQRRTAARNRRGKGVQDT